MNKWKPSSSVFFLSSFGWLSSLKEPDIIHAFQKLLPRVSSLLRIKVVLFAWAFFHELCCTQTPHAWVFCCFSFLNHVKVWLPSVMYCFHVLKLCNFALNICVLKLMLCMTSLLPILTQFIQGLVPGRLPQAFQVSHRIIALIHSLWSKHTISYMFICDHCASSLQVSLLATLLSSIFTLIDSLSQKCRRRKRNLNSGCMSVTEWKTSELYPNIYVFCTSYCTAHIYFIALFLRLMTNFYEGKDDKKGCLAATSTISNLPVHLTLPAFLFWSAFNVPLWLTSAGRQVYLQGMALTTVIGWIWMAIIF